MNHRSLYERGFYSATPSIAVFLDNYRAARLPSGRLLIDTERRFAQATNYGRLSRNLRLE
jgi:hypothetical protein